MTPTSSRPLIAVMQVTRDGYILGPEREADWVDSWADGLELLPPVDAFLLGGGMFPDYEQFWAAILDDPTAASAPRRQRGERAYGCKAGFGTSQPHRRSCRVAERGDRLGRRHSAWP